jgi:hypothetical protein
MDQRLSRGLPDAFVVIAQGSDQARYQPDARVLFQVAAGGLAFQRIAVTVV